MAWFTGVGVGNIVTMKDGENRRACCVRSATDDSVFIWSVCGVTFGLVTCFVYVSFGLGRRRCFRIQIEA
uniref:Transmembrane protein n=1 Tax=Panagrellus redivivus TaxID=6233 RepID=A0A7E4VX88_PANRE